MKFSTTYCLVSFPVFFFLYTVKLTIGTSRLLFLLLYAFGLVDRTVVIVKDISLGHNWLDYCCDYLIKHKKCNNFV